MKEKNVSRFEGAGFNERHTGVCLIQTINAAYFYL
jgi:hypothetical protein